MELTTDNVEKLSKDIAGNAKEIFGKLTGNAKECFDNLGEITNKNLDVNGDGKVDITDIIYLALKIPGVAIDRDEYLKLVLKKYYNDNVIQKAIETSPKEAKIDDTTIEKIADETIEFERKCATGASTALGLPGGLAVVATMVADLVQYFAFLIRASQKLMYLYGVGNIGLKEGEEHINDDAMNTLISCLGVMFGVQGADTVLHSVALIWIKGTQQAITKTSFQLMKPISTSLGKIVAGTLAKGGAKVIPLLGGVISGGLTYATFKSCCEKLRKSLRSLNIESNNNK